MDTKVLTVSCEDIKYNIETLANTVKSRIIAVIKGDGYGLGLINMVKILSECGISYFAVSEYEEAIKIRENGYTDSVLLLTPQWEEEKIRNLIENDITLTVGSYEDAKLYSMYGQDAEKEVVAHIKVDTGFGRFGFTLENKEEIIKSLRVPGLRYEGIFSHFSCSFEKKYKITKKQFDKYINIVNYLKEFNFEFEIKHIANSCAALRFPETRLDAVRLGSAILGRLPVNTDVSLKKIGKLKSNVLSINVLPTGHNVGYANVYKTGKVTDTAVIPVGYKDGYMVEKKDDTFRFKDILRYIFNNIKMFGKKNYINIAGQKVRIIGRVGLYNVVADITGTNIKVGDEALFEINPLMIDSSIKREFI